MPDMPSEPPVLFSEALLVEMEEIGIKGPPLKKQGLKTVGTV